MDLSLSQLPTTPTIDDFRILSRHLRSDSSGSSVIITEEDGMHVQHRQRTRSLRYIYTMSISHIIIEYTQTKKTCKSHQLQIHIHCICASIYSIVFLSYPPPPPPPPFTVCVCVCSPKRSPREILLDQDATINIFKRKYPKAKEEMEERVQVS